MEESEKIEMEKKRTRLTDSTNKLQELERLMCRIYEDMSRLRILAADNYVAIANGHEHHTEDDKCQGQQVDVPTQIVCHTVEQRGHKVAYGLTPNNAEGYNFIFVN